MVAVLLSRILNCVPLGVEESVLNLALDLLKENKISKLVAGRQISSIAKTIRFFVPTSRIILGVFKVMSAAKQIFFVN